MYIYGTQVETKMKECKKCKVVKPLTDFYNNKDGDFSHCKKCIRAYNINYHIINCEKIREKRNGYRIEVLEVLGNKCVKCGFNDKRALQIDHVNGGGAKELRSKKLGYSKKGYYRNVIESFLVKENKYQLLCANCNWIKKHVNNENVNSHK